MTSKERLPPVIIEMYRASYLRHGLTLNENIVEEAFQVIEQLRGQLEAAERLVAITTKAAGKHAERVVELEAARGEPETLPIPDFLRNQENLRAERAAVETNGNAARSLEAYRLIGLAIYYVPHGSNLRREMQAHIDTQLAEKTKLPRCMFSAEGRRCNLDDGHEPVAHELEGRAPEVCGCPYGNCNCDDGSGLNGRAE
jgi:hypothetical protein